jgi:hypothetical protein
MLGPALAKLQGRLNKIPAAERTPEQNDLLTELSLLSDTESAIAPILGQLGSVVDVSKLGFFSITRPAIPETVTRPDPSGGRCGRCGQYFPISTQPKA